MLEIFTVVQAVNNKALDIIIRVLYHVETLLEGSTLRCVTKTFFQA